MGCVCVLSGHEQLIEWLLPVFRQCSAHLHMQPDPELEVNESLSVCIEDCQAY